MNARETLRRPLLPFLGALLALGACHESSGSSPGLEPAAINLGLPIGGMMTGEGERWVMAVPEARHGRDLDGDGDLADAVLHTLDLAHGSATNTGVVIGSSAPRTDVVPVPLLALGPAFAVGAKRVGDGRPRSQR